MSSTKVPIRGSEIVSDVDNINTFNNSFTGRDVNANGVFGSLPMASPKYARHRQHRHHEYMDTMARMFIQVPPDIYNDFIASLPDPDTQNIAKVLTGDGVKQGGKGYFDFLLQAANHSLSEKVQITETLSDNYVAYFFGSSPPVWQYQGTLMNTYQDDWTMRMFRIYDEMGRGTQLAKRNFILRLRYDSMIVTGAMTNFNWSLAGEGETHCRFSFSLLVKQVQIIYGGLGSPTVIDKDAHFFPEGFNTGNTADTGMAQQTYIDCSATPAGVQQADESYDGFQRLLDTWADEARANPDPSGTVVRFREEVSKTLNKTKTEVTRIIQKHQLIPDIFFE